MFSRNVDIRRGSLLVSTAAAGALFVGVIGVIGVASPAQAAETCEAFGTITMGKYYLNNNLWGQDSGEGTQCVRDNSQDGDTISWSTNWSWTGGQTDVKSFVSSVLGWHWGWQTDGHGLPVQLSEGHDVNTGWAFQPSASGTYNVTHDLWLHSISNPGNSDNPTDEVMIWLYRDGGAGPLGELVGTVEVGGASWELYEGNIGWDVYSFVRTENTTDATLNLREFLDYLVAERGLDPTKYLSSVESGTEVFVGEGSIETSSYYANVQ